jgi:hypothetical protein
MLPSYADLDAAALRPVVARNYEATLHNLELRRPPRPSDLGDSFASTGAERARQGVATSDMLAAWRIGQESLYLLAATLVEEGPQRDQLLREFLELLMTWVDFAMLAAAEGHRRTELNLAREREHARSNLIRRMIAGAIAPAEVRIAVRPMGLDADGLYHAVRTSPTPSTGTQDLERYLGMDRAPTLAKGMVGLVDGDLCGFIQNLPTTPVPTPIGVSEPTQLFEFKRGFQHASRALDTARALGAAGVFDLATLGIHAAIVSDVDVGTTLTRRYVEPFEQSAAGDAILETVEQFLKNDLNVETTARVLGVHSNTIRLRLNRFEEKTGCSLRDAEGIAEIWWAVQRRQLTAN